MNFYLKGALFYVYILLVAEVLVATDAGILLTAILFSVVPAVYFWRHEKMCRSTLLSIAAFSLAATFLWEAIAYANGIWYELSSFGVRVMGQFPVETLFWHFAYVVMLVTAYEYFFDDRKSQPIRWDYKTKWLSVFVGGTLIFSLVYLLALRTFYIPHAYAVMLIGTAMSLAIAAAISHQYSWAIFKKSLGFALFMLPIAVIHEFVSLLNVHWVFANTSQYIHTIVLFGETVPVEKFVFLFLIPFWIVSVYELYLDDAE